MTKREVAAVVIRVLGLYGIVTSIAAIPWRSLQHTYSPSRPLHNMLGAGVGLVIGIALLACARSLAPLLAPGPDTRVTGSQFDAKSVLTAAILIIGLMLLVPAISGLALVPLQNPSYLAQLLPKDDALSGVMLQGARYSFIQVVVANAFYLVIGLLLIFGAGRIAELLNRQTGPVANDNQSE